MDKFDESITTAQKMVEPSQNFVDDTMSRIKPAKGGNFRWKLWVPALAGLAVVIILAVLILPSNKNSTAGKNASKQLAVSGSAQKTSNGSTSVPTGTDNATLASDLNSIGSSMNQENSDQNSASTSLNDAQYQIAIPTD